MLKKRVSLHYKLKFNQYYIMKDLEILKQVFTKKNILLGIFFNITWITTMYGLLDLLLYLRYDLGWI